MFSACGDSQALQVARRGETRPNLQSTLTSHPSSKGVSLQNLLLYASEEVKRHPWCGSRGGKRVWP